MVKSIRGMGHLERNVLDRHLRLCSGLLLMQTWMLASPLWASKNRDHNPSSAILPPLL